MKDKMIPEVVMSILYSRYREHDSKKIINSPFIETSNDYGRSVAVTLPYLKEVLEDMFGTKEE